MSISHQNMNMAANYGAQPVPQVTFDFVSSEMIALNYLVAPGNIVYLLDKENKVLYEKSYQMMNAFDLSARPITNQNGFSQTGFSETQKKEISEMIAAALSQYNPHIPKKERKND